MAGIAFGDPVRPIEVLFLFMANMAWNSAMNPGETTRMLADKDVPAVVAELCGCVDTWIAAATDGPRGLDDTELARRARVVDVDMHPGGTVAEAMRFARSRARAGDRIVVFGSFHTVGPALEELARAGLAARHA